MWFTSMMELSGTSLCDVPELSLGEGGQSMLLVLTLLNFICTLSLNFDTMNVQWQRDECTD